MGLGHFEAKLECLKVKHAELESRFERHALFARVWSDCLRILLANGTLDKTMAEVMIRIKKVTGHNCIGIRKINLDADDRPMLHTLYEITPQQIAKGDPAVPKIWPLLTFSPKAIAMFKEGKSYGGVVAKLPEGKKSIFRKRGILSFQAFPIQANGRWWGLITLEDTKDNNPLNAEDVQLLSTLGDMMGCFFERHQAEEALRISEKKLRLLAENTLDCIWHMDMNFVFTYVNPAVMAMLGYDPDEWIGSTLADHCSRHEMRKTVKILSTYMEDAREQSGVLFETSLRHRSGEEVPVEILGKYLFDPNGKVIGLQGTTRNISERKEAERERQRLGAQLRHSQKMEAMGTLAGGIAHDFNNILTAIIGYAELSLMDSKAHTRLHNNLSEIYRAGNRATELVKQILTFCRQTEHERKPIQIASIVKEALKLLRSSIPTTIEIISKLDENLGTTMADPTQVHQIIMNLCTNAAQAMEKKGGKLLIGLERVTLEDHFCSLHPDIEPGDYIQLTVADTGHGIRRDIIEKIFDPYFTTKKMGEGTGLGLSVSQGIVKSYGGEITVESAHNKGSTFRVYLPESSDLAHQEEETALVLPTGHQRILFVDDEPALVDMGHQRLTRLGYQVEAYTSSMEALTLFKTNPNKYDLVITDMTMPTLPGDRLAKRLIEIRPDIPIILCTGYSRQISDEKAAACGIRSFLMKPITIKEMADTVKRVLLQNT